MLSSRKYSSYFLVLYLLPIILAVSSLLFNPSSTLSSCLDFINSFKVPFLFDIYDTLGGYFISEPNGSINALYSLFSYSTLIFLLNIPFELLSFLPRMVSKVFGGKRDD